MQACVSLDIFSAYSNIRSSDSTIALSYWFWFYKPEEHGDKYPVMIRSLREQFGIARSGRVLELSCKKFPGGDARKIDETGHLGNLITEHSYVDNFITIGNYQLGNNKLTTSILATKMQELFLAYNLRLEDRVDAGMENPDVGNEHTNFGIKWFSDTDEIVPHFTLNLHKTV